VGKTKTSSMCYLNALN